MDSNFSRDLQQAPARPGVYLFKDAQGKVLYVGKAIHLRKRVQVYRRPGADGRERMKGLLTTATAAEFRVTDNEKEAILLEDRLVKLYQPSLNVLLKDDKSFLYVQLTTDHPFPAVRVARKRGKSGTFFGPYPFAGAARRSKRLLQGAFGLRDCSDHTLRNRARPCLKYGMGLCSAPCVQKIEKEAYARAVESAISVLGGKVDLHLQKEKKKMLEASAVRNYESALRARDRMRALQALAEPQKVRLQKKKDFDVLGLDERGYFALLQYRDGEWLHTRRGSVPFLPSPAETISQLLVALYQHDEDFVPEILVGALPEEKEGLEACFSQRLGQRVRIFAPQRGAKRALLRMAESNARAQAGSQLRVPWQEVSQRIATLLHQQAPAIVDCIDISHLQGKERVASKVRFTEGQATRSAYRRYLVGGGVGNDDFAAMREVVARVLARADEDGLPDLLVLDGGQGQLSAALESLAASKMSLPMVALAKARKGRGPIAAEERLFLPGGAGPCVLDRGTPERLFFERLRDEAHRFAIGYHRRRRENLRLVLEEVPGIGPSRRRVLLDAYQGKLDRIRDAPVEELMQLPGMQKALAVEVKKHLQRVMP